MPTLPPLRRGVPLPISPRPGQYPGWQFLCWRRAKSYRRASMHRALFQAFLAASLQLSGCARGDGMVWVFFCEKWHKSRVFIYAEILKWFIY
jgi:hypothetical protein